MPGSLTFALAYALSPDGRELAVEFAPDDPGSNKDITLAVYSVATGARLRAWTAPAQQLMPAAHVYQMLAWLNGGRQLEFSAITDPRLDTQLRALDVAGTGTAMMADSRILVTTANPATSGCITPRVTPDGETAICATRAGSPNGTVTDAGCAARALRFTAVPVPADSSGRGTRVLYQYPGACHDAMANTVWADASASTIIGVMRMNVSPDGVKETYQVGVIAGGRFRPLRIAPSIAPGVYPDLVF